MAAFEIGWNAATRVAEIVAAGSPMPVGSVKIGAFEHGNDLTDPLKTHENHVLWHHVRDALYFQGVQDMFRVTLLAPYSHSGGTPTPTPVPTISFASGTAVVTEGNSGTTTVTNTINVVRNGLTGPLTVNLTTGGTATSGVDYVAGPTSVTIPDGSNTVSYMRVINGDTTVEVDETIIEQAVLVGYPAATASKTITITNDDVTVTPTGSFWARTPLWSSTPLWSF